jgi:chromosome segregation ATPase
MIMKKIFYVAAALMMLVATGCKEEQRSQALTAESTQIDSLEKIIDQKDNEINDMMSTLNQIQQGFREITEAENRVTIAKDGERADKAQQIRENMKFIANKMKANRDLINKLRQQVRESSVKGDQLKSTIDEMVKQLEEKDQQLEQLRAELNTKDIHIAELDETITNLNTNVTTLTEDNQQKSQTISTQDKQLNTAWFVFGTKKELKEQRILDGDRVLQANFNKSYFTKIDIRVDKEIKLYSKSAKILTSHPSSSYTLQQDANKQYILRITNPQIFWSTSKYLVVMVK